MSLLLSPWTGGVKRGVPAGARLTICGSLRDSAFNHGFTLEIRFGQVTILRAVFMSRCDCGRLRMEWFGDGGKFRETSHVAS